ncbi:pentapeptide repeat-containing protein [Alteribacter keqinensis]|uniref:Pentapeptide repeat-containing protein n=1 Tax=Alteribacter keqinensis TaxID=2483800 RepID=A0A3M7TSV5_9BACI|nr:pentapeptide repeat-containing protein [Alteribacter keqinensis]RNA68523.1 pentapeptide repeat-containing protein [Alteribacter keqinensis]
MKDQIFTTETFSSLPEQIERCTFTDCQFRGADLQDVKTSGCVFENCDFTGARLNDSTHHTSAFLNCDFQMANLWTVNFSYCKMTGSSFTEAILTGMTIEEGDWSYVNLRLQSLGKQSFKNVRLLEADFYEADLSGAVFTGADLTRAKLMKALLKKTDLREAVVDGINFKDLTLQETKLDWHQAIRVAESHGAKVD